MADLYELGDLHHDQVAAREHAASDEVLTAYADAWRSIREKLDTLTGEIAERKKRGEQISTGWLLQRDRLEGLQRDAEAAIRDFAATASTAIREAQSDAVASAQAHAAEQVAAALGDPPPGVTVRFNRLPKEALQELVGFTRQGTPLREVLETLAPGTAEKVRSGLIRGLATGQNPKKIAAGIREALGDDLTAALRLSRTEVLRSYRESSRRGYEANPDVVERWRWTASRSARTCAMCIAMDGQEFPTSVRMGTHPNCRCTMVPVVKSLAEIVGDPSIPDTRPKQDTGPEWFAKQPESVQGKILGPGKLKAYQAGEFELSDLVGYRDDPKWGPVRWERSLADTRAAAKEREQRDGAPRIDRKARALKQWGPGKRIDRDTLAQAVDQWREDRRRVWGDSDVSDLTIRVRPNDATHGAGMVIPGSRARELLRNLPASEAEYIADTLKHEECHTLLASRYGEYTKGGWRRPGGPPEKLLRQIEATLESAGYEPHPYLVGEVICEDYRRMTSKPDSMLSAVTWLPDLEEPEAADARAQEVVVWLKTLRN